MNLAILAQKEAPASADKRKVGSGLVTLMLYFGVAGVLIAAGCFAVYKARKFLKDEDLI